MDAKTILIINAIYAIIISIFIIVGAITQNKNISFKKWGIGFILFALNFSILSFRDRFPIAIVGVLPHILTFIAFALINNGLTEILKIKKSKKVDAIIALIGTIGVLYFNNVTDIKAFIVIITQSFLIFETWIICFREKNTRVGNRQFILWTFGLSILLQIIRFIISMSWFSQLDPLSMGSGLPYISVLFFIIYILMSLTIISTILRQQLNDQNALIEEFLLYTSNVNETNGELVVDKILKTIQKAMCSYKRKEIEVTLSIGAVYTIGTQYQLEELISAADKGLYEVKNSGKNQVKYKTMI